MMKRGSPGTRRSRPDDMDIAAGLSPAGEVFAMRAERDSYLAGAQACRAAVLEPSDMLGLDHDLRLAIARRVALTSENPKLIAGYSVPAGPDLSELASGGQPKDPRLAAIAAHADLIARNPGRSTAGDLARLQAAGLSVPQIVALSELLAYVCFQIRVCHGLSLLEEASA